jgi:polar amino acid transport system substrate-binding protein
MTSSDRVLGESADWRDHLTFGFLQEPPFCFRDRAGIVRGCDVELAAAVNALIGGGAFEPVETVFAELLPGLRARRWMMTTGLFATPERRTLVDFSRPIWALPDGLLVRKADSARITGYRALAQDAKARLGVIIDQVQHKTAIRLGLPDERIEQFATQEEAAQAVARGRIDAYASVAMAHRGYLATAPDPRMTAIQVSDGEQPPAFGAFAFAKDATALRQAIDEALAVFLGSAEHRAIMRRYGFTDSEVARVSGSAVASG